MRKRPKSVLGLSLLAGKITWERMPNYQRALVIAVASVIGAVGFRIAGWMQGSTSHLVVVEGPRVDLVTPLAFGRCERTGTQCADDAMCAPWHCANPACDVGLERARTAATGAELRWSPTVAWDGSGWGLAYTRLSSGVPEVRFQRLSREGVRNGEARTVSEGVPGGAISPRLAWNGREYGVTWTERMHDSMDVYFARMSRDGVRVGSAKRISTSRTFDLAPALAWGGGQWLVAWYNTAHPGEAMTVRVARLSPAGDLLGEASVVSQPVQPSAPPAIAWDGHDFGVAWTDYQARADRSTTEMVRVGAGGSTAAPVELATTQGLDGEMALASDGESFASVSESDWRGTEQAVRFTALGATGLGSPSVELLGHERFAEHPALLWDHGRFAFAWDDNRNNDFGVFLSLLGADGSRAGAPVRVSTTEGEAIAPSMARGDGEFGVAWTLDRGSELAVYFARVSADGVLRGSDIHLSE